MCGTDGATYSCQAQAHCRRVLVAYPGQCRPGGRSGGLACARWWAGHAHGAKAAYILVISPLHWLPPSLTHAPAPMQRAPRA